MHPAKRDCIATALTLVLAGTGVFATAGETYYRWLDSQGNPVNSDRPPPPGVDYEIVTLDANVSVAAEPPAPQAEPAGSAVSGGVSGEAETAPHMQVVKNPEACKAARENLETLNTYARIRIPDGNGDYRYINEEEKEIEREKARQAIKQNCD